MQPSLFVGTVSLIALLVARFAFLHALLFAVVAAVVFSLTIGKPRPPIPRAEGQPTVLISGAASGIGLATARLFASRGFYVGVFDLNEDGAKKVADELGEKNACSRKLDVTNGDDCKAAVDFFLSKTQGRLDVLFCCAGVLKLGMFDSVPLNMHQLHINVNINGVINLIYHSIPALKKTKGARIVSMCSGSALFGTPQMASYSSSKFAVRGLTDALSLELEPHGIAVTDVVAPYVATPMLSSQPEERKNTRSFADKSMFQTPEMVAETVWKATHGDPRVTRYFTQSTVRLGYRIFGADQFFLGFLWRLVAWWNCMPNTTT